MARARRALPPKRTKTGSAAAPSKRGGGGKATSSAASTSRHAPRQLPVRSAREAAAVRRAYDRVRALCLAQPGVYEKEAWAAPTFRVDRGKMFLMFADNHHGDGRVAFWSRATPDSREAWLEMDPDRFFVPPYVGPSGWIGVRLEDDAPWDAIAEVVAEAARLGAPTRKSR
jgi:hypothetical protein